MEWEREFWHISFLTVVISVDGKMLGFARAAPSITAAVVVASCLL